MWIDWSSTERPLLTKPSTHRHRKVKMVKKGKIHRKNWPPQKEKKTFTKTHSKRQQRNPPRPMHNGNPNPPRALPVMLLSLLRPLCSLQWTRAASKSHWPNRFRMLLTLGRAGAGSGRDSQPLWLGLESRVGEEDWCCCCWVALVDWLTLLCEGREGEENDGHHL